MKWIEVCMETSSGEIDALCETLGVLGVEGISIEDEADFQRFLEQNHQYWDYVDESLTRQYRGRSRIKFYLEESPGGRETLNRIQARLRRPMETAVIDDAEWETAWQNSVQPIEIGKRLLILPDWAEPEETDRVILRMEPGLGFGTGSHETTRMCLEVMEAMDLGGTRVLDLGCGSGILGIAALLLGSEAVTACDVDPLTPAAARENAEKNDVGGPRYTVYAGDILKDRGLQTRLGEGYDLVLANIVADVIVSLSETVKRYLAPQGRFLCSGIIDDRAKEVEAALRRNGLAVEKHLQENEWHCYLCYDSSRSTSPTVNPS